eukprot:scaffold2220_cov377-Prasinococcus_capsulatus_cf.AAC.15
MRAGPTKQPCKIVLPFFSTPSPRAAPFLGLHESPPLCARGPPLADSRGAAERLRAAAFILALLARGPRGQKEDDDAARAVSTTRVGVVHSIARLGPTPYRAAPGARIAATTARARAALA